jgi:hypothetical protein
MAFLLWCTAIRRRRQVGCRCREFAGLLFEANKGCYLPLTHVVPTATAIKNGLTEDPFCG